jgi:hypothetical protein
VRRNFRRQIFATAGRGKKLVEIFENTLATTEKSAGKNPLKTGVS